MQVAGFLYLLKLFLSKLLTTLIGVGMEFLFAVQLQNFNGWPAFIFTLTEFLCRSGLRVYGILCLRAIWIRNWWTCGYSNYYFEGVRGIFDEKFTCFCIAASALWWQLSALPRTRMWARSEIAKQRFQLSSLIFDIL